MNRARIWREDMTLLVSEVSGPEPQLSLVFKIPGVRLKPRMIDGIAGQSCLSRGNSPHRWNWQRRQSLKAEENGHEIKQP